jgi:hypothetical protein
MYRFQRELADIKADDVVSRDRYPQMKTHPLANDGFLALSQAAEVAVKTAPTQSQWAQQGPGRLLFEVNTPFDFTSAEFSR